MHRVRGATREEWAQACYKTTIPDLQSMMQERVACAHNSIAHQSRKLNVV